MVADNAVVTKDVPPYAVVAGNPAVIKKWRISPLLITPMLRCRWWRFAPWQLQHLDPAKPQSFMSGVQDMQGEQRTFHTGSSFSHEAVSTISTFNSQLISKVMT